MKEIFGKLDRFGISTTEHSQSTLLNHLIGTHDILKDWGCPPNICVAGLCHSIYGTESFSKAPATLDNREYVRQLIGNDAESSVYMFGAHRKDSLWNNLDRKHDYSIEDRFTGQSVMILEEELANLITLTLANWLEQRPRASKEYLRIRKEEFLRSKLFLPAKGYQAFLAAYEITSE